jgi:hypothetical protein
MPKLEVDIHTDSQLPSDLLTPTLGSNYGLDGYPDMQYGMGVLEGVSDPDLMPAPALPNGLNKGAHMDVSAAMESPGLADLDWLEGVEQDPDRLPETPESIPELEEAWGVNRRTNGQQVFARDLTVARYEASLDEGSSVSKLDPARIAKIVSHAMRRSAAGEDIETITRQAMESVGDSMGELAPYIARVRDEHGLAGNVFVRAAAYPGYSSGRWAKELRKTPARYVIASEAEIRGATWVQDGRCAYTGKQVVTEVPWKQAHAYYAPRLELSGRKVATGIQPRPALRSAFLSQPVKAEVDSSHLPTHQTPDQRISREAARAAFAAHRPERTVYDPAGKREARRLGKVAHRLEQMERDNQIPVGVRDRILASGADPVDMLREAARVASKVRAGTYRGDTRALDAQAERRANDARRRGEHRAGVDARLDRYDRSKCAHVLNQWIDAGTVKTAHVRRLMAKHGDVRRVVQDLIDTVADVRVARFESESNIRIAGGYNSTVNADAPERISVTRENVVAELKASISKRASTSADMANLAGERAHGRTRAGRDDRRVRELVANVEREINRGSRGSVLRKFIATTIPTDLAPAAIRALGPKLSSGILDDTAPEARAYEGTVFSRSANEVKGRTVLAGEITKAATWARRMMSEGFAGKDLNDLLRGKFATALLDAAKDRIASDRTTHEGLSGFMYVDASAYASDSGATGCEKAAPKHRANQIPAVRSMPRCATCTRSRVMMDGTRRCATYDKQLVEPADVSGPEMETIRRANIRSTEMTDAESTAALFAPQYDPAEFGLRNAELEGTLTFDIQASNEVVAEIAFGGLVWE